MKTDISLGRAPLSPAVEDYLKTIFHLHNEGGEVVSTQNLAARLGVAPPSATAMVKKLAAMKLASHTPYRGVELTSDGEKIALEIVRHHRLIETFLAQILGMDWDKVHAEAERLEHVLSEELEAKMAEALGHPARDPHGAPIPTPDGNLPREDEQLLSEIAAGETVRVCRVEDDDPDVLRHLGELGLRPGALVEVRRAEKAEGVLHLSVEGRERVVGEAPTRWVWVAGV